MNAQQLKNAILQEAITGRLVPQDPNDEPASVLLDKIRKEKAKLVKEGKLKKKDLEEKPISKEEIPFEIPESWEWVRINDLGEVITGGTPSKQHNEYYGDDYPFYKPGDLDKGIDVNSSVDRLSQKGYEASRKLKAYSILVTCIGATIGKTGLISKEGACNQQINAIIPVDSLYSKYIYYTLCSPSLQSIIRKDAGQTTLPIMNKNNFCKLLFPLPPLAEQHRIVAKIEELLPKVEEYGKAQEALDKLNAELPERLKKSILQEAITGKLVPQDPNDEPASVLLDRIRKEKAKLVKEGKLKKKDLEEKPISKEEIPFEIPESWEWCRLSTLYNFIDYRGSTPNKINSGIPLVTAKNVKKGYNDYSIKDYISLEEYNKRKTRGVSKRGDLLFTTEAPLGNVSIADLDVFSAGQRLITLQSFDNNIIKNKVIMFFMLADSFQKSLLEKKTGTTVAGIKASRLKDVLIPLPPLAEQHRIVAKIEELLSKIDKLKTK